jgi:peptide/nickel transport system permease protein
MTDAAAIFPVASSGALSRWRYLWKGTLTRLMAHRSFVIGFAIFSLFVLVALFAPLLAPLDPTSISLRRRFQAPNLTEWFGTDNYGRSMWSRVVYGARISLFVGFTVAVFTGIAGALIGALAGYFRKLDNPLMRAMDALLAFPAILLAIALAAALGPSLLNAIIALSVVYTPQIARVTRASVLVIRELDYVQAAVACGAGHWRILWKHILPNSMAPLIVQLTFVFAYAVIAESILSFLGVGPPPPAPTWGNVIAEGRDYLREAPWICIAPGATLAFVVLGLNLLGDGLRDVLDPRLRV